MPMTPLDHRDDGVIRELFAELRSTERAQAPNFRTMLERQSAPRRIVRPLARFLVSAAAAVVFLAAGVVVWHRLHRPGISRMATVSSIVSWKSPTAILLRTPGRELLRGVPDLHSSILDRLIPTNKSEESGT
jgi:hypothetical protein